LRRLLHQVFLRRSSPSRMPKLLTCSILSAPSSLDSAERVCWNPSQLTQLRFPTSSSDSSSLGPCQWQPSWPMAIFVWIAQSQSNNNHYLVCSCSHLWYPLVCLVGYH
jgi:hypothetical protein